MKSDFNSTFQWHWKFVKEFSFFWFWYITQQYHETFVYILVAIIAVANVFQSYLAIDV